MKALFAALALLMFMTPRAVAQPPESRVALAREVIELSGGLDVMRGMMDTMRPGMLADLRRNGMDEADANLFLDYFVEEFQASGPRLIDLAAATYADTFSDEELEAMRGFWASPAGQALREQTPNLAAAMMRAGMVVGEDAGRLALERMGADRERRLSGS
jgi:Uncharacterized protein conserved in bacteria (DUF2059)